MWGYPLLHMFYPAECPVITPEHCQHTTSTPTTGLPPPHKHAALLIYSHTLRTSSRRFLLISCMSPWRPSLLLLLHFYFSRPPPPPPLLEFSPVPLFAGDCCFRGGCGGESSSLQGRDGEREKGKDLSSVCLTSTLAGLLPPRRHVLGWVTKEHTGSEKKMSRAQLQSQSTISHYMAHSKVLW